MQLKTQVAELYKCLTDSDVNLKCRASNPGMTEGCVTPNYAAAVLTNVDSKKNSDIQMLSKPTTKASTDVRTIAIKAIAEFTDKKKYVVVSGLKEVTNDKAVFVKLCQEQLNISPNVVSVKRLGKKITDSLNGAVPVSKPRKLLVKCESDTVASSLLGASREFRNSNDDYIRSSIYINKDLTKEEAQSEFEKRQRRKNRQQQSQPQSTLSADSSTHPVTNVPNTSVVNPNTPSIRSSSNLNSCFVNSRNPLLIHSHDDLCSLKSCSTTATSTSSLGLSQPLPGNSSTVINSKK